MHRIFSSKSRKKTKISQKKNDTRTYGNIRKTATVQGVTIQVAVYLMYFKQNYKLIAVDLSKQQALNVDP